MLCLIIVEAGVTGSIDTIIGHACFHCQIEGEADAALEDQYLCSRCPVLSLEKGPKLIEHIGGHLLHDPALSTMVDPCGLCLGSRCSIRLRKGSKPNIKIIDITNSRCPNLYRIGLTAAQKSTKNSPCSNYPLECPLCPAPSDAVWRYNLLQHIRLCHPQANLAQYQYLHEISQEERKWMREKYHAKPRDRKAKDVSARTLVISEEYTSSVTIQ